MHIILILTEKINVEYCNILVTSCSILLVQASGYGSGDNTYEDMEGGDEVKKVVEERVYALVCTC